MTNKTTPLSVYTEEERTVLHLAAIAAGKEEEYHAGHWNAYESRDDAFSLMVRLDIALTFYEAFSGNPWCVEARWGTAFAKQFTAPDGDREAATRQAITWVAALMQQYRPDIIHNR